MQEKRKADACVRALTAFLLQGRAVVDLSKALSEELGRGWTFVAALQWLSGQSAQQYFSSLPPDAEVGGVPAAVMSQWVLIAQESCSKLGRGAPSEEQAAVLRKALASKFEIGSSRG